MTAESGWDARKLLRKFLRRSRAAKSLEYCVAATASLRKAQREVLETPVSPARDHVLWLENSFHIEVMRVLCRCRLSSETSPNLQTLPRELLGI